MRYHRASPRDIAAGALSPHPLLSSLNDAMVSSSSIPIRSRPERDSYDTVVVGGGFFGCRLAHHLASVRNESCLLLEPQPELLQRASFSNQARVHNGYHYPRSVVTAIRSRINYPRWLADFDEAVDQDFEKYYGVGLTGSNVTATQFRLFCERVGASIAPAEKVIADLFDPDRIEATFRVVECAFDAAKLAQRTARDLLAAGVEVMLGSEAERVARSEHGGIDCVVRCPDGQKTVRARRVFNCTYARTNRLLAASGLAIVPLKHEIAEIALVEPAEEIRGRGFTIMCGPFFSVMPFPARKLYSFSHVRYTPHASFFDQGGADYRDPYAVLNQYEKRSRFPHMLRDSSRYMPCLSGCRYVSSLFEVKTVLPRSEVDDSRPILFKRHDDLAGLYSVMGAKIDNIYDMIEFVDRELEAEHASR